MLFALDGGTEFTYFIISKSHTFLDDTRFQLEACDLYETQHYRNCPTCSGPLLPTLYALDV